MTKISNIIRGVVGHAATYFNDKLANGDRSIKVWGFSADDYDLLETCLMDAGYGVKRVKTPGVAYNGRWVTQSKIRLHVRELN